MGRKFFFLEDFEAQAKGKPELTFWQAMRLLPSDIVSGATGIFAGLLSLLKAFCIGVFAFAVAISIVGLVLLAIAMFTGTTVDALLKSLGAVVILVILVTGALARQIYYGIRGCDY